MRVKPTLPHLLQPFTDVSVCVCLCVSHSIVSAAPWTIACQALLSMEFSRQEYWSGLPFPFPGDLPITVRVSYTTGRFFTIWTTRVLSEMIPNFPYPWKEQSGNPEILMSIERHWGHEESLEKKDQRPTETIVLSVGTSQDGCPSLTLGPPPPSPPVTLKRIKSRNPEKTALICIDRIP